MPESSSDDVYWVGPTLPFADLAAQSVPTRSSCNITPTDYGLVFSGTLDVEQLRRALASALQVYPYVAGRLQCSPEGEWIVAAANAPIALTLSCAPSDIDSTSPAVFQIASSVFIDPLPDNITANLTGYVDEPLARLKLTYWPLKHESSLFLSWSHVLGSTDMAFSFLHSLNCLYLCQNPVHVLPLEGYRLQSTRNSQPFLSILTSRQRANAETDYIHAREDTRTVELVFDAQRLQMVVDNSRGSRSHEATVHDAVATYISEVLSRVAPETARVETTVHSHLHLAFPAITFALPSPSLPPKRSRFYMLERAGSCRVDVRLWPGNPPAPADAIRVCVCLRRDLASQLEHAVRSDFEGWERVQTWAKL